MNYSSQLIVGSPQLRGTLVVDTAGERWFFLLFTASNDPEVQASFQKLKIEHDELESDFVLMSKMEVMTKSLKKSYEGLSTDMLDGYCKQLLKMITKNETLIKQCEGGRLDISLPTR